MHLQRAIKKVMNQTLTLSATVEKNLARAMRAFDNFDLDLAAQVIEADLEVDQLEVDLEEECLKTLAMHQPVATDLRYIVSVMKINNDLERVGDIAVTMAKATRRLHQLGEVQPLIRFAPMEAKAREMLRQAMDALINRDPATAHAVCLKDDEVDEMHAANCTEIDELVRRNPERFPVFSNYYQISHKIERIGDHATNIAEDVIYCLEGKIVRHFARMRGDEA